jgi:hypothetical protein
LPELPAATDPATEKTRFAVNVVDEWFCSSMEGEIPTMLLNEKALLFDLLKPEQVRQLLNSHKSGQQNNHKLLFSLVMLKQWLRTTQPGNLRSSKKMAARGSPARSASEL